MVHVWSINSGERFQGHHGPLVLGLVEFNIARKGEMVVIIKVLKQLITFYNTLPHFEEENSVGKGENAGNQHFLLVAQCFLLEE